MSMLKYFWTFLLVYSLVVILQPASRIRTAEFTDYRAPAINPRSRNEMGNTILTSRLVLGKLTYRASCIP